MDERRIHIDEFFRREMENKTDAPPPMVWDALEQRLDDKPGRKKLFPVWWYWAIIGLVVLSATGIIAGYMNDSEPSLAHSASQEQVSIAGTAHEQPIGENPTSNVSMSKSIAEDKSIGKQHLVKQQKSKQAPTKQTVSSINTQQENIIEKNKEKKESLQRISTGTLAMTPIEKVRMPVMQKVTVPTVQNIDFDESAGSTMSTRSLQMISPTSTAGRQFNTVPLEEWKGIDFETPSLQSRKMQPIDNNALVAIPSLPQVKVPSAVVSVDEPVILPGTKERLLDVSISSPNATVASLPLVLINEDGEDNIKPLPFRKQALIENHTTNHLNVSATALPVLMAFNFEMEDEMDKNLEKQIDASEIASKKEDDLLAPVIANSEDNTKVAGIADGLLALVEPNTSAPTDATGKKDDSSSTSKDNIDKTNDGNNESVDKKEEQPADKEKSNTAKEETPKEESLKIKFRLPLEGGIKAGMSRGTNFSWNANKFIIAPYVESKVKGDFSVIVQPSVQFGRAKTGTFNGRSYYEIHVSDLKSDTRLSRGVIDSSVISPNPPDTVFYSYHYSQTYDSIHVKSALVQNRQWDVELPIMMKYKVNKHFAVLAGVSAAYSSVLQTKEVQERFNGMNRTYTENIAPQTFYVTVPGQQPPAAPPPKAYTDVFQQVGKPYNEYAPIQTSTGSNFFRYGFMLGASATLKEVWTIEVMLHKTGVNKNAVQDKQLQKIYTQPYLRIMVGYKIF